MPVSFRCTGCRAKLHVPTRWAGGSVPCPRCHTRVVIPVEPTGRPAAAFEGRTLERSLAKLEPAVGGSFADSHFELPPAEEPIVAETTGSGVTLPPWVIYAAVLGCAACAAGGFVLGMWWAAPAVK